MGGDAGGGQGGQGKGQGTSKKGKPAQKARLAGEVVAASLEDRRARVCSCRSSVSLRFFEGKCC